MTNISIEKREHPVWLEYQDFQSNLIKPKLPSVIGQYQYLVKSEKGIISIVELPNYFSDGITLWEIYCLEGNLFEDVERFHSYDDALEQTKQYLLE